MEPATTAKQSTSATPDKLDPALQGLLQYCRNHKIFIAPSIAPRRAPGRGVSIYATRPIKSGQKLMSVPSKSLITTASVTSGFFTPQAGSQMVSETECGDELAVHAKLAAYFAFGGNELKKYERWMATWPAWEDFTAGMPAFWDNEIEIAFSQAWTSSSSQSKDKDEHDSKRRKTANAWCSNGTNQTTQCAIQASSSSNRPFIRSPALDGAWRMSSTLVDGETGLVSAMTRKITKHILSLIPYFPQLSATSQSWSSSSHPSNSSRPIQQFLHAWSLVNTRCFYYHLPSAGRPAPNDPNECMVLCPGMDLFNHSSDPQNCRIKYDSGGFSVTARRNYHPGEEVLLSYGAHTNDTLWVEYGFFLAPTAADENDDEATRNRWDEVPLDALLLPSLSAAERHVLEHHGYLGAYTLKTAAAAAAVGEGDGGVCYRTVVLACLKALGSGPVFEAVISGEQDVDALPRDKKNAVNAQIRDWMAQVLAAAEENVTVLKTLDEHSLLRWLGGSVLLHDDPVDDDDNDERKKEKNKQGDGKKSKRHQLDMACWRRDMCVTRWEQIQQMAKKAVELHPEE